ncbi:glycosyltransferase family 2 protein [Acidobacteriota bacterium]
MTKLSVVIPCYNEEETIESLFVKLKETLVQLEVESEIIFINDGSTDQSDEILQKISKEDKKVKYIHFSRNFGQTAALSAGIRYAQGDIIIPMDSDFQNDPEDIPRLLDKLEEGYDLVSGWRKNRKDNFFRTLLSKLANKLIYRFWGLKIHDIGCSIKAYYRKDLVDLAIYGEVHRILPLLLHLRGASTAEIPVKHHPRKSGVSKYSLTRIFKVTLDLITFAFMSSYFTKPNYVFGSFGVFFFFWAVVAFLIVCYRVFVIGNLTPTPMVFIWLLLAIVSIFFFLMGIIAEMITRLYFDSENRTYYRIKKTLNCKEEE